MGAKIRQSKARSASLREFFLHQSLVLADSALCFSQLRPPAPQKVSLAPLLIVHSHMSWWFRLRWHCAIYRLRFYSNLLICVGKLSISYNDISWIQENQPDKSHRLKPALLFFINRVTWYTWPTWRTWSKERLCSFEMARRWYRKYPYCQICHTI